MAVCQDGKRGKVPVADDVTIATDYKSWWLGVHGQPHEGAASPSVHRTRRLLMTVNTCTPGQHIVLLVLILLYSFYLSLLGPV